MKIFNKPEIIYLQIDDEIIEDTLDFEKLNEVSWCIDKIYSEDIPYYSKEIVYEFMEYIKEKEDVFNSYTQNKEYNEILFQNFLKEKYGKE